MNEITFRRVRKDELEKCLDILYEAFKDYSIYHIIIPNSEANHGKFNRALLSCQLTDSMANGIVMVAEREGEIISVIQLHSPEYKETTVFQYLFLGAFTVFRYGGIGKSLSFINMVNQCYSTNVEYAKNNPNCWDLECLAVKKKYQGQGIGSQVIQECIIPYVKKEGGKCITLITNEERNTYFYKKNGFELINDVEKFNYDDKTLCNWNFKKDL